MRGYEPTVPLWFCVDCTIAEVNGDHSPDRPEDAPEVLCAIDDDMRITPGMLTEEHGCGREDGEAVEECDCEVNSGAALHCDGCGEYAYGEWNAFTGWIPAA